MSEFNIKGLYNQIESEKINDSKRVSDALNSTVLKAVQVLKNSSALPEQLADPIAMDDTDTDGLGDDFEEGMLTLADGVRALNKALNDPKAAKEYARKCCGDADDFGETTQMVLLSDVYRQIDTIKSGSKYDVSPKKPTNTPKASEPVVNSKEHEDFKNQIMEYATSKAVTVEEADDEDFISATIFNGFKKLINSISFEGKTVSELEKQVNSGVMSSYIDIANNINEYSERVLQSKCIEANLAQLLGEIYVTSDFSQFEKLKKMNVNKLDDDEVSVHGSHIALKS